MTNIKEIDFMFEMAFNKALPHFYKQSYHITDHTISLKTVETKTASVFNKISMVIDVPSYIKVAKKEFDYAIGFKSIKQYNGYYIDLNGYIEVEDYLKDRFSRSSRQLLRAGKQRLEICFNSSYRMYYGDIDKSLYDALFKRFFNMLKQRANEKGIENRNLKHWDLYTKNVYDMILNKQASLFVIYDSNKAINISLNMHLGKTVYLFITTYDIDYSKFRLGHTNWMLQVEWFIKNDIKIVDFSKGNIEYKKRWANNEYHFEYHFFYNKSNILNKLKVFWMLSILKLKQVLRNGNMNTYYYNFLDKLKPDRESFKKINYELIQQELPKEKEKLVLISNSEFNQCSFLRRIVYNYLYISKLHVDEVTIYKELSNEDIFYLSSKKKGCFKINFKKRKK
jgi:hypothetical protein